MESNEILSIILLIVAIMLLFIGGNLLLGGCACTCSELTNNRPNVGPAVGILFVGLVLVGGGVGTLVLRHFLAPPTRGDEAKGK